MPYCLRAAVSLGLSAAIASLTLSSPLRGQVVWSGLTFQFDHPPSSDTQDVITPNVWLTRASTQGIYNAAYESGYLNDYSPENTLWATEINNPEAEVTASNWSELNFSDWRGAYGGPGALAGNIVDTKAVLYLMLDKIYLDIQFTGWGAGSGSGGAFAYLRAEPPPLEPTGDYNGNLIVDAADYTIWRDTLGQMVANLGDGADGDRSGEIDLPDYDHWKARFGNVTVMPPDTGSGAAAFVVPEPAGVALLISVVLGLILTAARNKLPPI